MKPFESFQPQGVILCLTGSSGINFRVLIWTERSEYSMQEAVQIRLKTTMLKQELRTASHGAVMVHLLGSYAQEKCSDREEG